MKKSAQKLQKATVLSANPSDDRKLWNAAYKARYDALNAEQKKAVDAIEGPVLVVAGPGSGKTEILGLRVGNILRQTDVRASNILCLTFTDSAAANMRERLASLIGPEAYHVAIYTFHSFATEIIRRYPEYFYGGAFFSPADPITQIDVVEEILLALPHSDPLSSQHPEQGFVYSRDIRDAIQHLKRNGTTPPEFSKIVAENDAEFAKINEILQSTFPERISMKEIGAIKEVAAKLAQVGGKSGGPLAERLAASLARAIERAEEIDKTEPLTAWKADYLKKDDEKKTIVRDAAYSEKLASLGNIYAEYRRLMFERGFYDFDDMLIDLRFALERNPALRYEIQEQFQYILIDEFQDTNAAQMKIVSLITDASVNEGRPNVMAVGDDDQAVYKFQGAEISNILDFQKLYKDPTVITMTGNYRSTQGILDAARSVIIQGEDRLENRIKGMDKSLKSLVARADTTGEKMKEDLVHHSFPTQAHEYTWVAKKVCSLIDAGQSPDTIALITRYHSELVAIVPYLKSAGVPIRYEREQNVFEEPHIRELIVMARYIAISLDGDISTAESLLPAILSFPFWGIARESIWKVSVEARKQHIPWLDAMKDSDDVKMKTVRAFLLEISSAALSEPLEKILDQLIGAHIPLVQEEDEDDETSSMDYMVSRSGDGGFESPFREFYFSRKNFESKRAEYLAFLSSLRVFVSALREFKKGKPLGIRDLVEFIDLYEKNNLDLHDRSPFANAEKAVTLMTAHKAKGLEYDTVFILSCQEDVWAPRNKGSKLPFPMNLRIAPAGDTLDDKLRLFYVALTRAKRALYLTSYDTDEKGNPSPKAGFLLNVPQLAGGNAKDPVEVPDTHDVLTAEWLAYHTPPFFGEEKALLQSLIEGYAMSVTHLNNFLDVTRGGPQYFLEQNLLRFPQAKTPSSTYGSVIHATLNHIYAVVRSGKALPTEDEVLSWFETGLRRERLAPTDTNLYLDRGRKALAVFYKAKKDTFKADDRIQVSFAAQGVALGGDTSDPDTKPVHLTGEIDKMVFAKGDDGENTGEAIVHDWKTGKASVSWQGKDDYEKRKLRNYVRQLHFYKILTEGSRDFSKYEVKRGILEFVEAPRAGAPLVDLECEMTGAQTERLKKLIVAVFAKISSLDFPDISKYDKTTKGIEAFEEDLLAGKI